MSADDSDSKLRLIPLHPNNKKIHSKGKDIYTGIHQIHCYPLCPILPVLEQYNTINVIYRRVDRYIDYMDSDCSIHSYHTLEIQDYKYEYISKNEQVYEIYIDTDYSGIEIGTNDRPLSSIPDHKITNNYVCKSADLSYIAYAKGTIKLTGTYRVNIPSLDCYDFSVDADYTKPTRIGYAQYTQYCKELYWRYDTAVNDSNNMLKLDTSQGNVLISQCINYNAVINGDLYVEGTFVNSKINATYVAGTFINCVVDAKYARASHFIDCTTSIEYSYYIYILRGSFYSSGITHGTFVNTIAIIHRGCKVEVKDSTITATEGRFIGRDGAIINVHETATISGTGVTATVGVLQSYYRFAYSWLANSYIDAAAISPYADYGVDYYSFWMINSTISNLAGSDKLFYGRICNISGAVNPKSEAAFADCSGLIFQSDISDPTSWAIGTNARFVNCSNVTISLQRDGSFNNHTNAPIVKEACNSSFIITQDSYSEGGSEVIQCAGHSFYNCVVNFTLNVTAHIERDYGNQYGAYLFKAIAIGSTDDNGSIYKVTCNLSTSGYNCTCKMAVDVTGGTGSCDYSTVVEPTCKGYECTCEDYKMYCDCSNYIGNHS